MKLRFKALVAGALLVLASATGAHALLTAAGPPDPLHGFPQFYTDGNGVSLAPCLSLTALSPNVIPAIAPPDPNATLMCFLLADAGFNTGIPVSFPANFPTEFFYWTADPDPAQVPDTVRQIVMALEGTFATPGPVAGQQAVFTRLRFRFLAPVPTATYVVDHPFGTLTFSPPFELVGAVGGRFPGVNFTEDIPAGVPLDFLGPLNGNIGPFLVAAPPPPLILTLPTGEQFIGDPNIATPVTGSPIGRNFIEIRGPGINPANLGGTGPDRVRMTNFFVAGMRAAGAGTPLTVERATFTKNPAGGGQVDVWAHSLATAVVSVSGGPNLPAGETPAFFDGLGNFFVSIPLTDASVLPAIVSVSAAVPPGAATVITAPLTDMVTITKAEFDPVAGTLTVNAVSSDQGPIPPVLNAAGLGQLINGTLVVTGVTVPHSSVTVTSSRGGSATAQVAPLPPAAPPGAFSINSVAPTTGTIGTALSYQVTTAGGVAPVSFSLPTAPAGMTISATGLISFTPTAAGAFNVTVRAADSTAPAPLVATQSFTVTVAAPPETLTVTTARVTRNLRTGQFLWSIGGTSTVRTGNSVNVFLGNPATGTLIGTAPVTATGSWRLNVTRGTGLPGRSAAGTAVSTLGTSRPFNWIAAN